MYVGAEYLGDSLLLGLTQLGKFLRHMGDRAVMLTNLDPLDRPTDPGGRRGVTGPGQRVGDIFGCSLDSAVIFGLCGGNSGQDRIDATAGESLNRLISADLPKLPHRGRGQIVVGVLKFGPSGGCQPVTLCGPTAAGLLPRRGRVGLCVADLDQCVEVPAHPGGGDTKLPTDIGCGDRPRFQQQSHNRAPGLTVLARRAAANGRLVRMDFHNVSVTQLA